LSKYIFGKKAGSFAGSNSWENVTNDFEKLLSDIADNSQVVATAPAQ
jgi:hypothetical protein